MPELAATTVLLLAASAFVAGAFGAMFGLGSGILLSFAVIAAFGVTAVVPVVSAAMIVGDAGRIWAYRGEVKRGPLLLAAGLTGSALLATDAALAAGTSLMRVASFHWLGLLPPGLLGARLARRLGVKRQAFAVETVAGVAGVVFLWQAWTLA